jgi:hypothetical protein
LEQFLIPPTGGMDWRLPEYIRNQFTFTKQPAIGNVVMSMRAMGETSMIDIRVQDAQGGETYYETYRKPEEPSMKQVFRDVWNHLFQPSPRVQVLLQHQLDTMSLTSGHYVAAHARLLYKKQHDSGSIAQRVQNAVHCAAQLRQGEAEPIFFTSDSSEATLQAVEYGPRVSLPVEARVDEPTPLHLDKGHDFLTPKTKDHTATSVTEYNAEDYMDVFVDLYLLANSRCVVYDVGGYGRWGSMLSQDPECYIDHYHHQCLHDIRANNNVRLSSAKDSA